MSQKLVHQPQSSRHGSEVRLAGLAQLSVPEKTNEITAVPDLLDRLAETEQLAGALVTIDSFELPGRDRRQDAHKAASLECP
jgi:hypothetical protein